MCDKQQGEREVKKSQKAHSGNCENEWDWHTLRFDYIINLSFFLNFLILNCLITSRSESTQEYLVIFLTLSRFKNQKVFFPFQKIDRKLTNSGDYRKNHSIVTDELTLFWFLMVKIWCAFNDFPLPLLIFASLHACM